MLIKGGIFGNTYFKATKRNTTNIKSGFRNFEILCGGLRDDGHFKDTKNIKKTQNGIKFIYFDTKLILQCLELCYSSSGSHWV